MNLRCFFPTQIDRERLMERLKRDPTIKFILGDIAPDCSKLDEYARKQLLTNLEDFIVFQILGDPGVGKSGVLQFFAERWQQMKTGHGFDPERIGESIAMHYGEFIDIFTEGKPGEFKILDEQARLHGVGSRRIGDDIINLRETCRKNQVSFGVASPTEKMLHVDDVHLTIEVLARDGTRCLCIYKSYEDIFLGAFIVTLEWANPTWNAYCVLKDAYIGDAKQLKFRKTNYEEMAEKVRALPDYVKGMKKSVVALLLEKNWPNMTTQEKALILTQVKLDELRE